MQLTMSNAESLKICVILATKLVLMLDIYKQICVRIMSKCSSPNIVFSVLRMVHFEVKKREEAGRIDAKNRPTLTHDHRAPPRGRCLYP